MFDRRGISLLAYIMPHASHKKRELPSVRGRTGFAARILKGLNKSIDKQIEIARDLQIEYDLALYRAGTADLFTWVSRGIDKWLWFVEAHSQASK
jgi:DNA-binding ferritin-like protein